MASQRLSPLKSTEKNQGKAAHHGKSTSSPRYWMYGYHAVHYALLNPKRRIHQCVFLNQSDEALLKLLPTTVHVSTVDKQAMQQLVGHDAVHQGVALEVSPLEALPLDYFFKKDDTSQLFMILDHVVDPHNVGAILRSCAVFGVKALIMTDRHSPKESPVLAKIACGALDLVPMVYVANLAHTLKILQKNKFWTVGLAEKSSTSLETVNWSGKMAIVMGAEGDGMRPLTKEYCDILAHLPTSSSFSTLNVSNAAAITLFEAFKGQRPTSPLKTP